MQRVVLLFLFLFCFPFFAGQAVSPQWGETRLDQPETFSRAQWGEEQLTPEATEITPTTQIAAAEEIPLPPWLQNGAEVPDLPDSAPMIALVIDDLGLNRKMTNKVLELPAPITASFLAYADDLPEQTEKAHLAGHELMVHAPMEPLVAHKNVGPGALMADMDSDMILARLEIMLDSFEGYVGINNHMGSRFTANPDAMRVVLRELKRRGLLFLDSLTSKDSVGREIAREVGLPYAVRNVFLDNTRQEKEILEQLKLLENHARRHQVAVGIGHPHRATVAALKKWIPQAKARGISFVPVSMVATYLQDADHAENFRALNPFDG